MGERGLRERGSERLLFRLAPRNRWWPRLRRKGAAGGQFRGEAPGLVGTNESAAPAAGWTDVELRGEVGLERRL